MAQTDAMLKLSGVFWGDVIISQYELQQTSQITYTNRDEEEGYPWINIYCRVYH